MIKDHYAVVVVGSGYGGSILASRLARAKKSVCVLERGKERHPGDFPETLRGTRRDVQVQAGGRRLGSPSALFDFHHGRDLNILVGCGLGGGSLINAGVALKPDWRVFDDPRWPVELRGGSDPLLNEGYKRAEAMLRPVAYPEDWPSLPKLDALERVASALGQPVQRVPITVSFQDEVNAAGVKQKSCSLCGNCATGCNRGAKTTTVATYLTDACRQGADIFTEVKVDSVSRRSGRWVVRYLPLNHDLERFGGPLQFVTADIVVLAAGTLGSSEILLRSRQCGLSLSSTLGKGLSANANLFALAHHDATTQGSESAPRPKFVHPSSPSRQEPPGALQTKTSSGYGAESDEREKSLVGPCITGAIHMRDRAQVDEGRVIEDGAVPEALARLVAAATLPAAALLGERPPRASETDTAARGGRSKGKERSRGWSRRLRNVGVSQRRGELLLAMGNDDANGGLSLRDDHLHVSWRGVSEQASLHANAAKLAEVAHADRRTYVPNPLWAHSDRRGQGLVTVHPLGGCVMADDAEAGVVDHKGRVFSGEAGREVYEGLYVADGSIVPRSLGVNPLLTISALSERIAALLAADRGWSIDYVRGSSGLRVVPPPRPAGLVFTEAMTGDFSGQMEAGEVADSPSPRASSLSLVARVRISDLKAFLDDPAHEARLAGSVIAPALSGEPLVITDGALRVLEVAPRLEGVRHIRYRCRLTSVEGRVYHFEGWKTVGPGSARHVWSDTTTLRYRISEGGWSEGLLVGEGILRVRPQSLASQLQTLRVTDEPKAVERLRLLTKFGKFFFGSVWSSYRHTQSPASLAQLPTARSVPAAGFGVGALATNAVSIGGLAEELGRRPRAFPVIEELRANDGAELRLTRHRGGTKGPVVLAPGLGVTASSFAADTVDNNITDFLVNKGYDVWLFDYRASPTLGSSSVPFTIDDIARRDWPQAVARVLEVSGASSVQVVAHCVGSMSLLMAMLSGLGNVRSVVCSQLGLHTVTTAATNLKVRARLASLVRRMGLEALSVRSGGGPLERAVDRALELQPTEAGEGCDSSLCRRILATYGPSYRHGQLNRDTHRALPSWFGVVNLTALEHMTCIVRHGRAVDHAGNDVYLPHLDRLAIPIRFLAGERNRLFLPESSAVTLGVLSDANGSHLYDRRVVPGYAHMDCFVGENAVRDVYPLILEHLEATDASALDAAS